MLTTSGTEPIVSPGIESVSVPTREPGAGGNAACGAATARRRTLPRLRVGTSAVSSVAATTGTSPPRIRSVPSSAPTAANVCSVNPSKP